MHRRISRPLVTFTTLTLCTFACIAALGCTTTPEDDDEGGGAGTPAAGGAGAPAAGGAGAPAAGAGAGGAGAGAAGMAAAPVMCGTKMCSSFMSASGSTLMPCCDMVNGTICGGIVGMMGECQGLGQPGEEDPSCASEMSVLGTPVPGCCRPDGKCGLKSGRLMRCVERSVYPTAFVMSGM